MNEENSIQLNPTQQKKLLQTSQFLNTTQFRSPMKPSKCSNTSHQRLEREYTDLSDQFDALRQQVQEKETIISEFQSQNSDLANRLELAGFSIFQSIMSKINFSGPKIQTHLQQIEVLVPKFVDYETQIRRLNDENYMLKQSLAQYEFLNQDSSVIQVDQVHQIENINFPNQMIADVQQISDSQNSDKEDPEEKFQRNEEMEDYDDFDVVRRQSDSQVERKLSESNRKSIIQFNRSMISRQSMTQSLYSTSSVLNNANIQNQKLSDILLKQSIDNAKMALLLKELKDALQPQLHDISFLKSQVQELNLEREYLEHALQEKKYTHQDYLQSEQIRKLKLTVKQQKQKIEQLRTQIIVIKESPHQKHIKISMPSKNIMDIISTSSRTIDFKSNKTEKLMEELESFIKS